MSDLTPQSPLAGATTQGALAQIADGGLRGSITLRGDLSDPALTGALKAATGLDLPGQRGAHLGDNHGLLWMSPDEVLLLCPYASAPELAAQLATALTGQHALVVNTSDARVTFTLTGDWRGVLARLTPADLRGFAQGELRRTRIAQVPAAFYLTAPDRAELLCFRSVARYVFDLLSNAASSSLGPIPRG